MKKVTDITGYGLYGTPIIITTRKRQARKHKKKRVNKKWLKRYGMRIVEVQEHGKPFIFEGKIYMTESDYIKLKTMLEKEGKR